MRRNALAALGCALFAATCFSAPASAQTPGDFDYYVFTLSWSPGFCDTGGAAKQPSQCANGSGSGFVVHGLWPNSAYAANPEDCGSGANVSTEALRLTDGVYPDEGLARYEYRKHGVCSGLDPVAYFTAVKTLRTAIVIPDALSAPHEALTLCARRHRAGLRRRQPQPSAREHGDHLPRRRADRRAHLRRQGSRRLRAMPESGWPHLPREIDLRRAVALGGSRDDRRAVAMNYRHGFHAGNFADVLKHAILARILVYLTQKDAALRFIDTHAGAGRYDLAGDAAKRSPEWRDGVARLLKARPQAEIAALLAPYLQAIGPFDEEEGRPLSYPGSPALAQTLLRAQDRLALCEAHPQERAALAAAIGRDARVKIAETDGYAALNAYVPPLERRGLVLIDPPYEAPDESDRVEAALARALAKWPRGTYVLWRPIKDERDDAHFRNAIAAFGAPNMLRLEIDVGAIAPAPHSPAPLRRTGLIVVNPPFRLIEEARLLTPWLAQLLRRGPGGSFVCDWLTPPA